jgi:transposase
MMCPATDNPAPCEIRAVIRFLHAKNMTAAEINRELCAVYGQNVMSEGTVRQWCRVIKDGRTNVHDEERSGRQSVVSDDLAESVDQKICGCIHIHQTTRKTLNKRLPARKLMVTVFWDREGVLMVEFMQQATTITSEVYRETAKKLRRPFKGKSVEC